MKRLAAVVAMMVIAVTAYVRHAATSTQVEKASKASCSYVNGRTDSTVESGTIPSTGCPYLDQIHRNAEASACPYSGEASPTIKSQKSQDTTAEILKTI